MYEVSTLGAIARPVAVAPTEEGHPFRNGMVLGAVLTSALAALVIVGLYRHMEYERIDAANTAREQGRLSGKESGLYEAEYGRKAPLFGAYEQPRKRRRR